MNSSILIGKNYIGKDSPVYFIADIAANHDGSLSKAKELIEMAAEAGAHAAKFQHFEAGNIVSDIGFSSLGAQFSHQKNWEKSVFETYEDASISTDWTAELKRHCDLYGITFFSSPYDFEMVDHLDPFVPAHKIGSGDMTWLEIIEYVARKEKPYLIATGASDIDDVQRAVNTGLRINPDLILMQCNTNYTGSLENFHYINLCVLNTYRVLYPNLILGLSDHTPGHASVLGAVALGVKVVEKHFTDDKNRKGPDHAFSMSPVEWREMQQRTIELQYSLGDGVKKVEANERETAILQRRATRVRQSLSANHVIQANDLIYLRPCPEGALPPYRSGELLGKKLKMNKNKHDCLSFDDVF
ncbi:N-acetylneuraminate synthase family protein [Alphaproteobacteria bacterium]|nr:N-acetylneuraminate synthase family protein [Alphaproteobacteria bacterium]